MSAGLVARVLLDSSLPQLDHLFDYAVPEALVSQVSRGVRVKVPFRSAGRTASGYVIELTREAEFSGALSDLEEVVSPVPVLTDEVWALARRVADRSAGNASDIIRLAVPPRQVRVEKAWLASQEAAPGETSSGATELGGETGEMGRVQPPPAPAPIVGYPDGRIENAVANGERACVSAVPLLRELRSGEWVGDWAITMAAAAAHCLAVGKSAILAVPDYRDQDQLLTALNECVPEQSIVRVDARQTNAQRYRNFLDCLGDEPRIILGNRSTVYAPAKNLGLVALWDDGDNLHAEPLAPYAHARDAALIRQELSGCALLLFGHSRSTEVQRLVELGWMAEILPDPVYLPRVIATGDQSAESGPAQAARIPSTAWREATQALATGPVLVQVARPGYAPVVACQRCRTVARCRRCAGPLGLATAQATPACGWCGALASDFRCPVCESTALRMQSIGASRTAEELGRAFPGARVILSDGTREVTRVDDKPALVVATRGAEPIASGGYHAVILLDGERMLARESLRVAEDCLRSWSNASALAAPRAPIVLAGVSGPLAAALATWQQARFASTELADRRALRFPPAVRVASATGVPAAVAQAVADLAEVPNTDVLGPVDQPDGTSRAIVRTGYANAGQVAASLRAAVVRHASRSKRPSGPGTARALPTLRVRFDDPEIL